MSEAATRPGALWPAGLALGAGSLTLLWAGLTHRLLLFGDATAHLAIARRMVDSATPGLSQWGTVWLPLPHLLMAPFVLHAAWWRSGLAGSFPSLLALALATWLLHRIVSRLAGAVAAAWATAFFCLNPSLLYLSVVPMTESIYLAAFLGAVDQCALYAETNRPAAAWRAGGWALAATLCRYDGWFLLPFAALALALAAPSLRRGVESACRFALVAGLGPVFWLLYNWWYFGDALAFLRGPYSAHAIAHRGSSAASYPGDHNLALAALYFLKTVVLTCGVPLALVALGALMWGRRPALRRALGPLLLLLPLPWYLWAMYSGNVPIFVPQYWPHGYYNLRYGVQLLPAVAALSGVAAGAMARGMGRVLLPHARAGLLAGLALLCGGSYVAMLRPPGAIAYAEAAHNAPDRLAMEAALARALAPWHAGERVLMYYGTYPGALADDGIPVSSVLQESNFLLWLDALASPQRHVDWVVAEQNTPVAKWVNRRDLEAYFHPVATLREPHQPEITIYRINAPQARMARSGQREFHAN